MDNINSVCFWRVRTYGQKHGCHRCRVPTRCRWSWGPPAAPEAQWWPGRRSRSGPYTGHSERRAGMCTPSPQHEAPPPEIDKWIRVKRTAPHLQQSCVMAILDTSRGINPTSVFWSSKMDSNCCITNSQMAHFGDSRTCTMGWNRKKHRLMRMYNTAPSHIMTTHW